MQRVNSSTRSVNYGLAMLDVNKKCKQANRARTQPVSR